MAELATIARPYAEALFKSVERRRRAGADPAAAGAGRGGRRTPSCGSSPTTRRSTPAQVFERASTGVAKTPLDPKVSNLLRTVIDNGRLAALPEIAAQFNALVNRARASSDATVDSAFPIDAAQLPQVVAALEKRFGRKLNATVVVDARR